MSDNKISDLELYFYLSYFHFCLFGRHSWAFIPHVFTLDSFINKLLWNLVCLEELLVLMIHRWFSRDSSSFLHSFNRNKKREKRTSGESKGVIDKKSLVHRHVFTHDSQEWKEWRFHKRIWKRMKKKNILVLELNHWVETAAGRY